MKSKAHWSAYIPAISAVLLTIIGAFGISPFIGMIALGYWGYLFGYEFYVHMNSKAIQANQEKLYQCEMCPTCGQSLSWVAGPPPDTDPEVGN